MSWEKVCTLSELRAHYAAYLAADQELQQERQEEKTKREAELAAGAAAETPEEQFRRKMKKMKDKKGKRSVGPGLRVTMKDGSNVAVFLWKSPSAASTSATNQHQGGTETGEGETIFAIADKCCHGKGQLSMGDIEDIPDKCEAGKHDQHGNETDGNSVPGICVRCPKHAKVFPGGLLFSLQDGQAFVRKKVPDFSDIFRVPSYEVQLDKSSGSVSIRLRSETVTGPSHWLAVRLHKASTALKRVMGKEGISTTATHHQQGGIAGAGSGSTHAPFWRKVSEIQCNHDSYVFQFERVPPPSPENPCLFPADCGPLWHVALMANCGAQGELVSRDYTPISTADDWIQRGVLDLLVKVYPDGKMTRYMRDLPLAGIIDVSTPRPTLKLPLKPQRKELQLHQHYEGPAVGEGGEAPVLAIGMIAGGTGITPMVQLMRTALYNPDLLLHPARDGEEGGQGGGATHVKRYSRIEMALVYSNRRDVDVLMLDELEFLRSEAAKAPHCSIEIVYTITRPDAPLPPPLPPKKDSGVVLFGHDEEEGGGKEKKKDKDKGKEEEGGGEDKKKEKKKKDKGGESSSSSSFPSVAPSDRRFEGRITQDFLQTHLPKPAETGRAFLVSGPEGMYETTVQFLVGLGHREDQTIELEA